MKKSNREITKVVMKYKLERPKHKVAILIKKTTTVKDKVNIWTGWPL